MAILSGIDRVMDASNFALMLSGGASNDDITQSLGGTISANYYSPHQWTGTPTSTQPNVLALSMKTPLGSNNFRLEISNQTNWTQQLITCRSTRFSGDTSISFGPYFSMNEGSSSERLIRRVQGASANHWAVIEWDDTTSQLLGSATSDQSVKHETIWGATNFYTERHEFSKKETLRNLSAYRCLYLQALTHTHDWNVDIWTGTPSVGSMEIAVGSSYQSTTLISNEFAAPINTTFQTAYGSGNAISAQFRGTGEAPGIGGVDPFVSIWIKRTWPANLAQTISEDLDIQWNVTASWPVENRGSYELLQQINASPVADDAGVGDPTVNQL